MTTFTKILIEKNRSINDIEKELMHVVLSGQTNEDILLATVQELANAIISIQKTLEFDS